MRIYFIFLETILFDRAYICADDCQYDNEIAELTGENNGEKQFDNTSKRRKRIVIIKLQYNLKYNRTSG